MTTVIPDEISLTLTFRKASATPPPFGPPILAALGSWRDEGRGFHSHVEFRVVKVTQMDTEGDEDEGSTMACELESGAEKWADLQFTLTDAEGEEISDCFSDSIMWWTDLPVLPYHDE